MLKQVISGLLRLALLGVVFLGSCVGSGVLYLQSPKWDLEPVDLEQDKTFFGAYVAENNADIEVVLYRFLPGPDESENITYRMPRAEISQIWEGGGSATITAEDQSDGSQLVRIHAIGDTPWVSMSEYRVSDNEIEPLRHGAANHAYLLGALLSPFLTWLARRPVRWIVGRVVGTSKDRAPG